MGAGLLANAVYQWTHSSLTHRIREQARSHIGSSWISKQCSNDQNLDHSHKFCAILANCAAYCIELDSHKGFAA